MRQRQGKHGNLAVRSPGSLSEMFRQDDTGSRFAATASAALRHLPCQNTAAQTDAG